jgi:hypothetical protein
MEVRMFHKFIAVAAWTVLAFIAYATISPIQDRPTLPTSSSFEHLAAFAVLGTLFCAAYPRQIVLVCLIVLGGAVLLEIMQLLTPDRHGRIQDGERSCRHRGWSSNPLFPPSQPPVPELTRSADIKLNERVWLRHHLSALSLPYRTLPTKSGRTCVYRKPYPR